MSVGEVDVFAGLAPVPDDVAAALRAPLIDHHLHTHFRGPVERQTFADAINEGSIDPVPGWLEMFDSPIGFAIRRWCGPLLGLARHASADAYWAARTDLGDDGLARLLLPPAGVRHWLIDTGYSGDAIVGLDEFTAVAGGTVSEIIRLEALGETLVAAGAAPAEFPDAFRAALAERDDRVVGTKTIVAYRCGFDQDWAAPSDDEVVAEVQRWQREWAGNGTPRMVSPVMSSFAVHAAAAARLPVQFHVGFGDRDLDLNRVDPLLLLPLLRQPQITRVPILLLHCYPFHRNAGYLAQAFENVYFDVGLAINYLGSASVGIIGEALELAPFAKQLYSSDAFGPPELHLLGSVLWRRGMATVLTRLVDTGDWSDADAARVVRMIGSENAVRAYRL